MAGNKSNSKRSQSKPKKSPKKLFPGENSLWLDSIIDPFDSPPASIPDPETAPTHKCKLTARMLYTPTNYNSATSITHNGLLLVSPIFPDLGSSLQDPSMVCSRQWDATSSTFKGDVEILTHAPPNFQAAFPAVAVGEQSSRFLWKYRVTSMGVKVLPEVPELYRSGVYRVGLIPNTARPQGSTTVGTGAKSFAPTLFTYGAFGSQVAMGDWSTASVVGRMTSYRENRINDGPLVVSSHPMGVPSYTGHVSNVTNIVDGYPNTLPSIGIIIEGDTVSDASISGNTYRIEVIWNVEILAVNPSAHVLPVTPSLYSPQELAVALNGLQLIPAVMWGEAAQMIASAEGSGASGEWAKQLANHTRNLVSSGYSFASTPYGQRILMTGMRLLMSRRRVPAANHALIGM
jgi:hypothetical protein